MATAISQKWRSVPSEHQAAWSDLFSRFWGEPLLSSPCPVCGERALRRYFSFSEPDPSFQSGYFFRGKGGKWQWCSNCRCYEHFSSLVPFDWQCGDVIDRRFLMHDPGAIDEAYKRLLAETESPRPL